MTDNFRPVVNATSTSATNGITKPMTDNLKQQKIAQAKRHLIIEMMHYNSQIRAIQSSITSAVSGIDMLKAGVDNAFDKLLRELDENDR